jgi:hypothetical protein
MEGDTGPYGGPSLLVYQPRIDEDFVPQGSGDVTGFHNGDGAVVSIVALIEAPDFCLIQGFIKYAQII